MHLKEDRSSRHKSNSNAITKAIGCKLEDKQTNKQTNT